VRIGKIVACILLILLIPSSIGLWFPLRHDVSASATIRVPQDYVTIQAAVDHSGPGDTILVSPGVYYEHVTLSHASSFLAIVGENPATTIIDGGGTGTVVSIGMTAHLNNSILTGLTIRNGDTGIEMGYISQCPGIHNCILNNNKVGIYIGTWVEVSSGIYHNSFINNTDQVWASNLYLPISWDNGYPSGGNYWSDYNGTDLHKGLYQNETGSDGIGDTHYIVQYTLIDNYPLMQPFLTPPTIVVSSPQNATYYSSTISLTFVVQEYSEVSWIGYSLDTQANITIAGNTTLAGLSDGTHTVTVYANDTAGNMGSSSMVYFSVEIHDIALMDVSPSKSVVGQTLTMKVNTNVLNPGRHAETFNVTTYANTTIIETTEVTLTSGNSTNLTLTWNTTGFVYGNYSVSAYASPVEGETLTEDNTLVDGWVLVTIPGDVNGDKKVNILDCILIANHFGHADGDGHAPGSKEWLDCANCDINSDGRVNVLDCIILSSHFGQSWT
jgi:hypothetical protein